MTFVNVLPSSAKFQHGNRCQGSLLFKDNVRVADSVLEMSRFAVGCLRSSGVDRCPFKLRFVRGDEAHLSGARDGDLFLSLAAKVDP